MVLEIDSSRGEGGGQMVRTSVALATLTGTTTRLTRIRENRPTNGLSKQHTTAVNAIAQIPAQFDICAIAHFGLYAGWREVAIVNNACNLVGNVATRCQGNCSQT